MRAGGARCSPSQACSTGRICRIPGGAQEGICYEGVVPRLKRTYLETESESVREGIEVCREVTGHPIPCTISARRVGDPAVLIASSDLIQRDLGWKPDRPALRAMVADAWAAG